MRVGGAIRCGGSEASAAPVSTAAPSPIQFRRHVDIILSGRDSV
jgi:hypothetical protein